MPGSVAERQRPACRSRWEAGPPNMAAVLLRGCEGGPRAQSAAQAPAVPAARLATCCLRMLISSLLFVKVTTNIHKNVKPGKA